MIVAVASGKGGTGKTTVATSLALSLQPEPGETHPGAAAPPILFLDCDVEAPDAHLFLHPVFDQSEEVGIQIPEIDAAHCSHCRKCADVCQFHAIMVLGDTPVVFAQLCHSCGSCTLACPEGAISEKLNAIGRLERGKALHGIYFTRGILDIGEPMAVPIIRELKKWTNPPAEQVVIIDSSPGTSCPVVESIRGADLVILVTEPTPFGLHDLKLAVEVTRELHIAAAVVINRFDFDSPEGGYAALVEKYCRENELPVLMRIPFERQIAEGIAQGKTLIQIHPEYRESFREMILRIKKTRVLCR